MVQPLRDITRQHHSDRVVERLQQQVAQLSRLLADNPLLQGRHLEDITVSQTPPFTRLEHKLDRTPVGYIITKLTTNLTRLQFISADDTILELDADGADFNGSLWVF